MEKANPPRMMDVSTYGSTRAKAHVKRAQRMRRDPDWYERNATALPPKEVTKSDLLTK